MPFFSRLFIVGIAICAIYAAGAPSVQAEMTIHLSLGAEGDVPGSDTDPDADDPDIEFDAGILSTADDGELATTGNQNTAVEFEDFPVGVNNIPTAVASFTLQNLMQNGPATAFQGSTLVGQDFVGGTLALYSATNELLLSGNLTMSGIYGTLLPPGKQGFFGGYGTVTGGSLAPVVVGNERLFVSMTLPTINACDEDYEVCQGFSMTPAPLFPLSANHVGALNSFFANALVTIEFRQVPEPSSAAFALIGFALMCAAARRRNRG